MKSAGDAWRLIGLMSGTSADGVDAALVTVRERKGVEGHPGPEVSVRLDAFESAPYTDELRERIMRMCAPGEATVEEICLMNFVLGEIFADAAHRVAETAGVSLAEVDLIGSHGQTIYHLPEARRAAGWRVTGSTLQIGEPAVIAERTGVTTVADFRTRDMAAGGQGAPLVSRIDQWLFSHPERARALLNIGGIGNLTLLPPTGSTPAEERSASAGSPDAGAPARRPAASGAWPDDEVLAFDTGPGNMVIDGLVSRFTSGEERFDRNGERAARGRVDEALVARWMEDPYVQAPPPKSTGRERYGARFVASAASEREELGLSEDDLIATATAFTAESIARHLRVHAAPRWEVVDLVELMVAGGGSQNPTLMRMLRERVGELAAVRVMGSDGGFGWDAEAREAIAFALLAYLSRLERPGNVPAATGAARPVVLGKILPGRSPGPD